MGSKLIGVKRTKEQLLSVIRTRTGEPPGDETLDRFLDFFPEAKAEIVKEVEDGEEIMYFTAKFTLEFGNWMRGQRVDFDKPVLEEDVVKSKPEEAFNYVSDRSLGDEWKDSIRRLNNIR